jgi:hypothetical protein
VPVRGSRRPPGRLLRRVGIAPEHSHDGEGVPIRAAEGPLLCLLCGCFHYGTALGAFDFDFLVVAPAQHRRVLSRQGARRARAWREGRPVRHGAERPSHHNDRSDVLRRSLAFACLTSLLGASSGIPVRDPSACAGACDQPIHYLLDARFNPDERSLIEDAMSVWERGTGGRVCFAAGGNDLVIERLERSDELAPYDPDWPRHVALTKGGRIWIVAPRIDDPGEYRALAVHELGHHLGIGHIEDTTRTYMHSTINDTPADLWTQARLPPRDGQAFCEVHPCRCTL